MTSSLRLERDPDVRPLGAGAAASNGADLARPGLRAHDATAELLSDVRIGESRGGSHLHARLAAPGLEGVELRARERDGVVEVALVLADRAGASDLRADLGRIQDHLESLGMRDVTVVVEEARGADSSRSSNEQDDTARDRRRGRWSGPPTGDADLSVGSGDGHHPPTELAGAYGEDDGWVG